MKLRSASRTFPGRDREHNEDAVLCDPDSGLFIVADGMGGRVAGETASRVVIHVVPRLLEVSMAPRLEGNRTQTKAIMRRALRTLSEELYERARESRLAGLGSTAAILLVRAGVGYVGYAGDSRVYLLRQRSLVQISEDQTTAAILVKAGHLPAELGEHSPLRHSLEEFIGREGRLEPGIRSRSLRPGDRFLLCSDGVAKGLSNSELRSVLTEARDADAACVRVVEEAVRADGTDDTTAIVVDVLAE